MKRGSPCPERRRLGLFAPRPSNQFTYHGCTSNRIQLLCSFIRLVESAMGGCATLPPMGSIRAEPNGRL